MAEMSEDFFGAGKKLSTRKGDFKYFSLNTLEDSGIGAISKLPFTIKILLESLLRNCDNYHVMEEDVKSLASWNTRLDEPLQIGFLPARVLLQDFTGVPAVVDLAALRSAIRRLGGDPGKINPQVPVDLVIDHSVQVDKYGSSEALLYNSKREFERNRERYEFLRWGQDAFDNFRVVPPETGIVHQVNLEYLGRVVESREEGGEQTAFPDTLVGTDSHTTMINGLGILGWGVGGIEAEAVMLGQPIYMLAPEVIGVRLTGALKEGVTATDLVLAVTQMLREHGVVGKFVEFYGKGLSSLSLADRATIANMSPEYGATCGFFPVDAETLNYLRGTNRQPDLIDLVEKYCKEQGLFRTDDTSDPEFTETLDLDMGTVETSMAGPKRPQDRVKLSDVKASFLSSLDKPRKERGFGLESDQLDKRVNVSMNGSSAELHHGSVIISAITSCTNTSNPSVMIGAGLLARNAVERGLEVKPHIKTSLAPGSKVVMAYLKAAGLVEFLEKLRFHLVGYGCTTCIGNSGPVPESITEAVENEGIVAAAVLSGNRNFEGRINPQAKASYLASPPLVVAYALAGRVDIDLESEPIGKGWDGEDVYLRDIWPSQNEVRETLEKALKPEMFKDEYADVFTGNPRWNEIEVSGGDIYEWKDESTYIREPGFFVDLTPEIPPMQDITGARALAMLGDSVTTDHISPAGVIAVDSPAGEYLIDHGVEPRDFNSFGSRRGNHEVMMRGTFGNIRINNHLVPGKEGGYTVYHPTGETMSIYDAAMKYKEDDTPLIVIAGRDYGMGSSRDWAAKGTYLLGVKAVVFESIERIHRSNLIGMGVLPLQFRDGESADTLGLTGREVYEIRGFDAGIRPSEELTVIANSDDGEKEFQVTCRIDTMVELEYFKNGGILHTVLRKILKE